MAQFVKSSCKERGYNAIKGRSDKHMGCLLNLHKAASSVAPAPMVQKPVACSGSRYLREIPNGSNEQGD